MHVERNLITSGVAAVAADLDVALFPHRRERAAALGVPQLDFHDVGFQIIQNQIVVDNALQLLKQRVAFLGVVRADLALLLVAVDADSLVAENVGFLFDVGGQLRGVFLQIFAQPHIAGRAIICGKSCIQIMRHIFAFDFHAKSSDS